MPLTRNEPGEWYEAAWGVLTSLNLRLMLVL